MNGENRGVFGWAFSSDEWPHGLRCQRCDHVLRDGERFTTFLSAFAEDVPVLDVVCVPCGVTSASRSARRA